MSYEERKENHIARLREEIRELKVKLLQVTGAFQTLQVKFEALQLEYAKVNHELQSIKLKGWSISEESSDRDQSQQI